jgi:hypothetical protein
MRTKTLLLTAILGVASIAAALAADPVYSVNAVGYVNVVLNKGFTIVANPLNAGDNHLSKIFPNNLPSGTVVYRYTGTTFALATFAPDDNNVLSWDNDLVMAPGEGFFVKNPSAAAVTVTFVGEVMQSTSAGPLANTLVAGFNLKGSMVPQSGDLKADLGYPAENGDVVYRYVAGNYKISTYAPDDNNVLNWDLVPTPAVGEGFWIKSKTAKTWNRTFTVN